jgi:hypothetical protein
VDETIAFVQCTEQIFGPFIATEACGDASRNGSEPGSTQQDVARFGGNRVGENAGEVIEKRLGRWRENLRSG